MKVIAKTEQGYLIEATDNEIKEISKAVTGQRLDKVEIGMKLPAIDYAGTITKIKTLRGSSEFINLESKIKDFVETFDKLRTVVKEASEIEV